jgi:hypothetical protein
MLTGQQGKEIILMWMLRKRRAQGLWLRDKDYFMENLRVCLRYKKFTHNSKKLSNIM